MSEDTQPLIGSNWVQEVKRLELRPGDVLAIRAARHLTSAEAGYVSRVLEELFEDRRVVVLQPGLDIEVMGQLGEVEEEGEVTFDDDRTSPLQGDGDG